MRRKFAQDNRSARFGYRVFAVVFLAGFGADSGWFVGEKMLAVLFFHEEVEPWPEIIDMLAGVIAVGLGELLDCVRGVDHGLSAVIHAAAVHAEITDDSAADEDACTEEENGNLTGSTFLQFGREARRAKELFLL